MRMTMDDTFTSAGWRSALRALLRALQSLADRFRHHVQQPDVASPAPRTLHAYDEYQCSCGLVFVSRADIDAHVDKFDPPENDKRTFQHYVAAIFVEYY